MRPMLFALPLLGVLSFGSAAWADPDRDESGHGHRHGWRDGEPPDWARGRGVWDGHFKHGRFPDWSRGEGEPPDWARGRGGWDGHFERHGPPPWAKGRGRGRHERRDHWRGGYRGWHEGYDCYGEFDRWSQPSAVYPDRPFGPPSYYPDYPLPRSYYRR